MMSSLLADAHAIRRVQSRLAGQAQLTLRQLQELAVGLPPEAVRNLLLEALPGVAQTFGDASAVAAGEWFEELRAREVGTSRAAVLADPVDRVPVEQSVRYASQHLFTDTPHLTFDYLAGQLVKWVAQPARETLIESIDADPVGYGWQRVTRPGACGFCLMLADRGGVYTRKGVYFASHRNCNCGVVPSWDASLPVVDVEAYRASERMDKVRARASGPPSADQRRAQEQLDRHRKSTREAAKRYETSNKGGGKQPPSGRGLTEGAPEPPFGSDIPFTRDSAPRLGYDAARHAVQMHDGPRESAGRHEKDRVFAEGFMGKFDEEGNDPVEGARVMVDIIRHRGTAERIDESLVVLRGEIEGTRIGVPYRGEGPQWVAGSVFPEGGQHSRRWNGARWVPEE